MKKSGNGKENSCRSVAEIKHKIQKHKAGTSVSTTKLGGLELIAKFGNYKCVFANWTAAWYYPLRNTSKLPTW